MELRSVAYNPTLAPGMGGMMEGMSGMQGMMPGGPAMYPPSGFVNLDVDMDPGFVSLDLNGPMPCSPCSEPVMQQQQHYHHHCAMPMSMPAPTSYSAPVPEPEPTHEVYVVQKGDTVYKIAKRYGTTMQAIILGNNLRNPNLIYPGQILFIPGVSSAEYYG